MIKRLLKLSAFLKNNNLKEESEVKDLIKIASGNSMDDLQRLVGALDDAVEVGGAASFSVLKSLVSDAVEADLLEGHDIISGSIEELKSLMSKESLESFDSVDSFSSFDDLVQLSRDIRDSFHRNNIEVEETPQSETPESPSEAPTSSYRPSTNRVSAESLYADLMSGVGNRNLCIAMVANAIGESALYVNANGDCGDYARNRGIDTSRYPDVFKRPDRGRCCSFGLWQYNICGGLGISLLEEYGDLAEFEND